MKIENQQEFIDKLPQKDKIELLFKIVRVLDTVGVTKTIIDSLWRDFPYKVGDMICLASSFHDDRFVLPNGVFGKIKEFYLNSVIISNYRVDPYDRIINSKNIDTLEIAKNHYNAETEYWPHSGIYKDTNSDIEYSYKVESLFVLEKAWIIKRKQYFENGKQKKTHGTRVSLLPVEPDKDIVLVKEVSIKIV